MQQHGRFLFDTHEPSSLRIACIERAHRLPAPRAEDQQFRRDRTSRGTDRQLCAAVGFRNSVLVEPGRVPARWPMARPAKLPGGPNADPAGPRTKREHDHDDVVQGSDHRKELRDQIDRREHPQEREPDCELGRAEVPADRCRSRRAVVAESGRNPASSFRLPSGKRAASSTSSIQLATNRAMPIKAHAHHVIAAQTARSGAELPCRVQHARNGGTWDRHALKYDAEADHMQAELDRRRVVVTRQSCSGS